MNSKTVLIIISLLLIATIVGISIYMFTNREAPNLYSILLKLGAPIIAAFLLLASDIYKADRNSKKDFKIYYLINNESGEPFPYHKLPKLKDQKAGLETIFFDLTTIRSKRKEAFNIENDSISEENNQYLAISILYWLAKNYNLHWELINISFEGLDTEKAQLIAPNPGSENNKKEVLLKDFENHFPKFNIADLPYKKISLPKGTEIEIQYKLKENENKKLIEKIVLENPYSKLEFSIGVGVEMSLMPPHLVGGERENFMKLVQYIPKYENWRQVVQNITLEVHHNWVYQWSPETNEQKKWIEDLKEKFEEGMARFDL